MQKKNSISPKYKLTLIPLVLAAALFGSCENIITRVPHESTGGGYAQGVNSGNEGKGGALTVTVRLSGGAARSAMPSIPELTYAALLYHPSDYPDGDSPENPPHKDFATGTPSGDKLDFLFQRPDEKTSGFTLEIFAFVKAADGAETEFSRENALLSSEKIPNLEIVGDAIVIDEAITLSSAKPGTVELKIKVPDGCELSMSETNEDGTAAAETHFAIAGTSPDFTVTHIGEGLPSGMYQVNFTVKNGEKIVCTFFEYINVSNGMCTDTWDGKAAGEAKEITQDSLSKTVYVRGAVGWYATSPYKDTATADDNNSGSFLAPFATIQKAVDAVIKRNDGTSAYTICVDGTVTGTADTSGANGMADFTALNKNLNLTIKGISANATLDGGARFDSDGNITNAGIGKRVIYAKPASGKLDLTLENLAVKGGNFSGGGGIYFGSTSGTLTISGTTKISGNKATDGGGGVYVCSGALTMTGGTISGNEAANGGGINFSSSGRLTISGTAKISGNIATGDGGGIYSAGTLKMEGGTISENEAANGGGINFDSTLCTLTISGTAKISGNKATNGGGGVYVSGGTLKMEGGTISENEATSFGGGVCVGGSNTFKMSGGTIGGSTDGDKNTARFGGGVYVSSGTFTMEGGAIKGNTVTDSGGGIYVSLTSGTLTISGTATISGNKASDYGGGVSSQGTLTMSGGTIGGTSASDKNTAKEGGGVYVCGSGVSFTMTGGTIKGNTASTNGGGICVSSTSVTLTISGTAKISGNTATSNGGGVWSNGTLTMSGGTIGGASASDKNTAKNGGGVFVSFSTFTMEGGTIGGNTASTNGGGIHSSGTLTMTSGTISGNVASTNGGGVYVSSGTLTMNGGTISGNTATYYGKGIYNMGTFAMSGAAKVAADNYVYLLDGKTIQVAGTLTAATPVATITPASYAENTQVLSAGTGVTITQAVCDKFALSPDPTGMEWKIGLDSTSAKGIVKHKYELGDTGPGGGWVFYYSAAGFTVNGATCHYLECSKEEVRNGTVSWCSCIVLPFSGSSYCDVTTSTAIGTGYANTQAILTATHPGGNLTAANCAAKACAEYATATTSAGEWFLPSKDELNKIYNVLVKTTANGGLERIKEEEWNTLNGYSYHWSSSQKLEDHDWALIQKFSDGTQDSNRKHIDYLVRAVHAF